MEVKVFSKRIGIPRALLYYRYYPFWRRFLGGLGFEILVSPPTNKEILYRGIKLCSDESCFPIKVFIGHIDWLKDKVDYLFVYRIASIERKGFLCSKFWGLPDITRNIFPRYKILTLNIDCNKSSFFRALFFFGLRFTKNPFKVLRILREANIQQDRFLSLMEDEKLNFLEAMEVLEETKLKKKSKETYEIKIAVLGHSYNLYDYFINKDILKKLEGMGVEVLTPEMIPKENLLRECEEFKDIYWTYDRELAGALSYFIKEGIDGIIFVVSFPCGPDALIIDYLIRKFKESLPILNLVIDEHQADSGILTRLESFIDIVKKRRKR